MRRLYGTKQYMSEMNMTPMIDVMLVLLVIFMITAPMLSTGIDVNLPKTKQANNLKENESPIIISINKDGAIYIGSLKIVEKELLTRLQSICKANKSGEIFIRADRNILYGKVVAIMGKITNAGFEKVSLVTDIE